MISMLFLNACATAGDILKAALLSTYHVQDLSKMKSFLVALNVANFCFCNHAILIIFYNYLY